MLFVTRGLNALKAPAAAEQARLGREERHTHAPGWISARGLRGVVCRRRLRHRPVGTAVRRESSRFESARAFWRSKLSSKMESAPLKLSV